LYKIVIIFYLLSFGCFVLFSRIPDYFDGEFTPGIVKKATFSKETGSPLLEIDFKVGNKNLQYITHTWFLTSYKPGQAVTMIYNPGNPASCSIYAVIGYWIRWPELLFTAAFFIILFLAAKAITGRPGSVTPRTGERWEKQ
jgi:hypothetical protein